MTSDPAPLVISTDGSCLANPRGPMGWAWVDHAGGQASGGAGTGTNQIAELSAVLEALRAHPGTQPLVIEADSQYAINCSTTWLPGWKRKGWKTSAGKPVKNVDLIRAIDSEIAQRQGAVRFVWVRGHNGDEFNEQVDELARTTAESWSHGRTGIGTLPPEALPAIEARSSARGGALF